MTRFQESLGLGTLLLALWAVLLRQVSQWENPVTLLHTQLLPIYGVLLFGGVSAVIVLHRVFTFNDCPEANKQLQAQIKQAVEDLKSKGFVFADRSPNKKVN